MLTKISIRKTTLSRFLVIQALIIFIQCSNASGGQTSAEAELSLNLNYKIEKAIKADSQRIENIFKDIHQNPELGFMEVRTAGIVKNELISLGFDVKSGIGKTGVLGILRNGEGPTVLYRADMDANAVEETTTLPYASKVRVTMADGKRNTCCSYVWPRCACKLDVRYGSCNG